VKIENGSIWHRLTQNTLAKTGFLAGTGFWFWMEDRITRSVIRLADVGGKVKIKPYYFNKLTVICIDREVFL
jgi:hypothetical protein